MKHNCGAVTDLLFLDITFQDPEDEELTHCKWMLILTAPRNISNKD